MVRTDGSHPSNRGSIPRGATKNTMTDERKQFIAETLAEQPIEPLPEELAERFTEGRLNFGQPIVWHGGSNAIYRCFSREENLSGIGPVTFQFDYQRDIDSRLNDNNELKFEYVKPSTNPEAGQPIAQMHFEAHDPNRLVLLHRWVDPELRTRSGLGTRLLKQAEDWIKQAAVKQGHDIEIYLETGQRDVIDWIQKNGYNVVAEQQAKLEELTTHPERFILDQTDTSEEYYIFRKGVTERSMHDAIRLAFVKTILS